MTSIQPRNVRRRLIFYIFVALAFAGLFSHSGLLPKWNSEPIGCSSVRTPYPRPANSAAQHTYLPNGILKVNPNGSHPILELIRTAEENWQAKLDRASKTLEEAVAEYKRRYKRAPPKGFDDW